MKFYCEKQVLLAAITTAARASAGKSPIPALEGLLFETDGFGVRITGYDLKKGIYTSIEAQVENEGKILLTARLISEIVRSMPDGIVTVSANQDFMTKISCGNAEFDIMGSDPADYPELPKIEYESGISIEQSVLRNMLSETLFAVSDSESRPIYTGALFDVDKNELTIVAVDGFRLALRRETITDSDKEENSFVVPGIALSELEKICSDTPEMVRITVGAKHISFTTGETVLVSRRIEGEFLDYKKTIPSEFPVNLTVSRSQLQRAVDRVSLIIDERAKNPLRCVFGEDLIKINCLTPLGKADDVVIAEGDGKGLEMGFNSRYLKDSLRAAPSEELKLSIINNVSPFIITPEAEEESGKFLYMILPIRLKAED